MGASFDANIFIVPDDKAQIKTAIMLNLGKDYIFTTGGTGISPRDFTPEVTEEICEKELPVMEHGIHMLQGGKH